MDQVHPLFLEDAQGSKGEDVQRLQKGTGLSAREKFEIQVQLHTGETVGSWSREWMIECEAKHLLKMPLARRRTALWEREDKRGKESVDQLKAVMLSIHQHRNKTVA